MCIQRETREKARQSLAFPPVSKTHTHIIYIANKMTFITHGFRVSVVSDVGERVRDLGSHLRFMLRRSSLVECVSVLHGMCLQCVNFFLSINMCSYVCQKIRSTLEHFFILVSYK
jgi:hypothetical protein